MKQTKEQLKKKAAALRLALRKTAAAAEEVRLQHEAAAQEAAQLEEDAERLEEERVAEALEAIRQRVMMDEDLEQKVLEAPHLSLWERFLNSFK